MRRIAAALAFAALAARAPAEQPGEQAPAAAQSSVPLAVHVGGRVIREPGGAMRFGWPGVYFEGRFRGTSVRVRFEGGQEHMRLLIDGDERMVFRRSGTIEVTIAGLAPGEHSVRLEKQTESQTGGGRFLGFEAVGGAALPARPRPRQIEYVGDSYTVGYGNTSPVRECSRDEIHATTDTQQSYASLAARAADADYRIHAYSGFGIVRNYSGRQPGLSLPAIYRRLAPDAPGHLEAADPAWRPRLIVINLGTNDFSTPLQPGEPWADEEALNSAWRHTYADFVRRLARRHPSATFILMGSDMFHAQLEQVGSALRRELPGRIRLLRYGPLENTGCNFHPSLGDHRRMADALSRSIAAIPDLWAPTPLLAPPVR